MDSTIPAEEFRWHVGVQQRTVLAQGTLPGCDGKQQQAKVSHTGLNCAKGTLLSKCFCIDGI
jgi:hypothetical protein